MHHSKRGEVLIINNQNFELARKSGESLEDRMGTDKDQFALDQLFERLGFRRNIRNNRSSEVMWFLIPL